LRISISSAVSAASTGATCDGLGRSIASKLKGEVSGMMGALLFIFQDSSPRQKRKATPADERPTAQVLAARARQSKRFGPCGHQVNGRRTLGRWRGSAG